MDLYLILDLYMLTPGLTLETHLTVIVAGHVDFDTSENIAEMLLSVQTLIEGALGETGCKAYSWTEDHLTPGRVWVYEEWESSDTLDTHLNTDWYRNMLASLGSHQMLPPSEPIYKYRVAHQEPVYDDTPKARGHFFTADEPVKADMPVIVAGTIQFANAAQVPDILTSAKPHIDGALTETGCIAYSWTQCHLNPGRVQVYEEWTSSETLEAHLNSHFYRDMGAHLASFERIQTDSTIMKYRIDLQQPVYDETGVAKGHFIEP